MQVNVVVMRGVNDDEIADFVELTRNRAINVRFIEYMPFDGNVWSNTKMVTYKEMMTALQQRFPGGLQRMQVSTYASHSAQTQHIACTFQHRTQTRHDNPVQHRLQIQPMQRTVQHRTHTHTRYDTHTPAQDTDTTYDMYRQAQDTDMTHSISSIRHL